jgi:hypothetical protein
MAKAGRFLSALFGDGFKAVSIIAPVLSITFTVCKALGVSVIGLQDISYAWAFAPITLWLLVAYVRRWNMSDAILSNNYSPNIRVSDAIDYIVNDSATKLKQAAPPRVRMESGPASGQLITEICVEHQDARGKLNEKLISGELKSWGLRQITTHISNQFEQSLREIPQMYWEDMQLDFQSCLYYSESLPQTMNIPGRPNHENWCQVQVSKEQVQKIWPTKSVLLRLYAKITKKSRISHTRSHHVTK